MSIVDKNKLLKLVRFAACYGVGAVRLAALVSKHTEPHGIVVTRKNAERMLQKWRPRS